MRSFFSLNKHMKYFYRLIKLVPYYFFHHLKIASKISLYFLFCSLYFIAKHSMFFSKIARLFLNSFPSLKGKVLNIFFYSPTYLLSKEGSTLVSKMFRKNKKSLMIGIVEDPREELRLLSEKLLRRILLEREKSS